MTRDSTPQEPHDGDHRVHDVVGGWEAALCRLEDVLLAQPYDEVLPDLADLLQRARVPLSLVEQDERARKLLGEAMLARPAEDGHVLRRARVRVELLTVEVQVLAERLRDPDVPADQAAAAVARLAHVEEHLRRLTDADR